MLKKHMAGTVSHAKGVSSSRTIEAEACTFELVQACTEAKHLTAHAIALSYPKKDYKVLMSPDTSDLHRGSFVTKMLSDEMDRDVAVEEVSRERLGFLSGTFRGAWCENDHICGSLQSRLYFRSCSVRDISFEGRLPAF